MLTVTAENSIHYFRLYHCVIIFTERLFLNGDLVIVSQYLVGIKCLISDS